jgi:hypothetical protein
MLWVLGFVLMCDVGFFLERIAAGYDWPPIVRLVGLVMCCGFGSAAVVKFCMVAWGMFNG